jgi:hypothetical protein
VPPPPKTFPDVAVPLPDVKVYRSSSTFVIEKPASASIAAAVNPSNASTDRNLTVSPVLLP